MVAFIGAELPQIPALSVATPQKKASLPQSASKDTLVFDNHEAS
jgi:hypothetical protein